MANENVRTYVRSLLETVDERLQGCSLEGLLSLPFRRLIDYVESFSRLAEATSNLPEGTGVHEKDNSFSIYDADRFLKDIITSCGGLPKSFLKRVESEPLPYAPRFKELADLSSSRVEDIPSGKENHFAAAATKEETQTQEEEDERTGASAGTVQRAKADVELSQNTYNKLQEFVKQGESHVATAKHIVEHGLPHDQDSPQRQQSTQLLAQDDELTDQQIAETLNQQIKKLGLESFSHESLKEVMDKLEQEENELYEEIRQSEHRPLFEAFIQKKKQLLEEEQKLTKALEEHEDALEEIRERLANPPQSLLPSDPHKSALYLTWKRSLADREKLLRQARKRKHNLIRTLKARHESQILSVEAKNRNKINRLKEEIDRERETAKSYQKYVFKFHALLLFWGHNVYCHLCHAAISKF